MLEQAQEEGENMNNKDKRKVDMQIRKGERKREEKIKIYMKREEKVNLWVRK